MLEKAVKSVMKLSYFLKQLSFDEISETEKMVMYLFQQIVCL